MNSLDGRLEVRHAEQLDDLTACEQIQSLVWGMSDAELVPASLLSASQHAGGIVALAVLEGKSVGFCYGFPAYRPERDERPGLHSHMTAVVAQVRGLGIGRRLKEFQREWCREQGMGWIEWTFDPLRAANARFNLEHLGATVGEYLVNAYGEMRDSLNEGLPSDRLLAHWNLDSENRVGTTTVTREEDDEKNSPAATAVLEADADGNPQAPVLDSTAPAVSVAVPADISGILVADPGKALAWRLAVRETMMHYLTNGYVARGFSRGSYTLRRQEASSKVKSNKL